jgi:hypothetical protein
MIDFALACINETQPCDRREELGSDQRASGEKLRHLPPDCPDEQ